MKQNDDNGQWEGRHTDADVVDALAEQEPAGTADVAAALDVTRQAADYRLRRLRDDGRVVSDKIGGVLVWSTSGEEAVEHDDAVSSDARREPTADRSEDLEARVRELNIPGSGSRFEARVDAIVDIVEHLEEVGEARTDELKALVDADAVNYSSADSFWTNVVRTKKALKDLSDVEAPGKGEKVYRYKR
jgi:DNA-binding Lrp family transcriptional regulator